MSLRVEPLDRVRWSRCAGLFLDYSYRQLWDFGVACALRLGAVSEHLAILEGNEVLGVADVRVKQAPVIGGGIAYINGGPLVRRGDDRDGERLGKCLDVLLSEYVHRRSLILRIAPVPGIGSWPTGQAGALASRGFIRSDKLRSYRTFIADIRPALPDIRKNLDQKWRNCLNASDRCGLQFRTGCDEAMYSEFCELYGPFLKRKHLAFDLDAFFYAGLQKNECAAERLVVTLVEKDGRPVAGHVASMLGDTCVYLHGATSEEGLKVKAGYAVQWHVIAEARNRGLCWYDLGGIDPVANPGVYHFKKGIGGSDLVAPGPFEARPAGLRSVLVAGTESLYRRTRTALTRTARPLKTASR